MTRTQQAPICEDCGEPCFPAFASQKSRRTRCHDCGALLCFYCYDAHKRMRNEQPGNCVIRMVAIRERQEREKRGFTESPIARTLLAPTQEDNPQVCAACRKGECEDCYGDCPCPHTPAG